MNITGFAKEAQGNYTMLLHMVQNMRNISNRA